MPKASTKIKRGARLTGEARTELVAFVGKRYADGATVRQLHEETGRSFGAIQRLLSESGVAIRPRGGSRVKS